MVVADVYNHRFHKIYRRDDGLNQIMDKDDIFVCVLSPRCCCCPKRARLYVNVSASLCCRYEVQEEDGERMNLPVYFRERHSKHSTSSSTSTVLFGQPLLITVPKHNLRADVLYDRILERIG